MRRISGALLAMGILLAGASAGRTQAVSGERVVADRGAASAAAEHPVSAVAADARTEKQKELAQQTERLFDMATELKAEVDKTNKNILSLKVVEKAEEIEAMAKGMRGQTKR